MLRNGLHDVPPGRIAAVVTHLEMSAPAPLRPERPLPAGVRFLRIEAPEPGWYQELYRRIGADWLWFSRLAMPRGELVAVLSDPDVEVHALQKDGRAEALLELDFREAGECELAFFGIAPALIGHGAGRWLMNRAIGLAWARPIRRFHVHTCTLDHPGALDFYIRSGFVPTRRQIEIAPDPRLAGTLARSAAPQVPII